MQTASASTNCDELQSTASPHVAVPIQWSKPSEGDGLAREQYRSRSLSASVKAGYALRLHRNESSALYLEP